MTPPKKHKNRLLQLTKLKNVYETYKHKGLLNTPNAQYIEEQIKILEEKIKNPNDTTRKTKKYTHKQIEIKRKTPARESIEKEKLIKLLLEENRDLIISLDSHNPYDEADKHEARLNYKSYLNVQTLLRELQCVAPHWTTNYYGNPKHYTYPTLDEYKKYVNPIKARIMNVLGDTCSECTSTEKIEIHHVHPIFKGGSTDIENIKILCKSCHKLVHKYDTFTHTDFIKLVKGTSGFRVPEKIEMEG